MNPPLAKPDISILDKRGHFYFGLTERGGWVEARFKNFGEYAFPLFRRVSRV